MVQSSARPVYEVRRMMTSVVRGLPHALMSRRSRHCRDSSTDINEEILVYGDDEPPFMYAGPGVSDGSG